MLITLYADVICVKREIAVRYVERSCRSSYVGDTRSEHVIKRLAVPGEHGVYCWDELSARDVDVLTTM